MPRTHCEPILYAHGVMYVNFVEGKAELRTNRVCDDAHLTREEMGT